MYFALKTLISALVIALVSEVSKKSTLLATALMSLPIVSILSFIWIYIDTKDTAKIAKMSLEILWFVAPSLVFFVSLPFALKQGLSFWIALVASIMLTSTCYALVLMLKAH